MIKKLFIAIFLFTLPAIAEERMIDPIIGIDYKTFFDDDIYLSIQKIEDSVIVRGAVYGKKVHEGMPMRFSKQEIEKEISLETYKTLKNYFVGDEAFRTFSEPDLRSGTDGSDWNISLSKGGYSIQFNAWMPTMDDTNRYEHFMVLMRAVILESGVEIKEELIY